MSLGAVGDQTRTRARDFEVVALSRLGNPKRLAQVAEAVFGTRDRPPGWFARKLRRECVDPSASPVAIAAGTDPTEPAGWLGYVLVGAPPSLGFSARTAGTAVVASARGRGIATALLDAAVRGAQALGRARLQLLADPELASFYRRCDFALVHDVVTLVRPSRGDRDRRLAPGQPWDDLRIAEAANATVQQWLPETWRGTEDRLRHTLDRDDLGAHISREGRALVVHRLLARAGAVAPNQAARALLGLLPQGHPVVLPLLPEVSPITDALLADGWHPMQRAQLMSRSLPPSGS
ncbi:MAG: GNAT family N-acetyltransferase [Myxococcota bacterium]